MELLEGIYTRRSVRMYREQPVSKEHLREIIKAGTWAPSGLNNQPWRFAIICERGLKSSIASQTKYRTIIECAPACLAVFVDRDAMYHETKDHQAIGACIQNMLLAAHALGLGAVWLGEILRNAEAVRNILGLPATLQLMAVIALGHPAGTAGPGSRKDPEDMILLDR